MLYVEDNKKIYITKGDDASLDVTIQNDDGTEYVMQDGDKLTLTVRELPDENSEILIQTSSETKTLTLTHDDTNIEVGKYSCDIQLTKQNGEIITIFSGPIDGSIRNYRNFIVGGEVT